MNRTFKRTLFGIFIGLSPLLLLGGAGLFVLTQPVLSSSNSSKSPTVDAAALRKHVDFLADPKFPRSYPRAENLDRAADYIRQQFSRSGGTVTEQTYQVDEQTYRNIIVTVGPDTRERIVVGAHYDSYGNMPGADDNASGIAGLIELANVLAKAHLDRKVELVAYTLEEPPNFRTANMGSTVHATALKKNGVNVRAMICLEMIGYFTDKENSQEYPVAALKSVYPSKGEFIAVVGSIQDASLTRQVKAAMQSQGTVPVWSINAPPALPGIDFSDHLSYWAQGYDAVMITDTAFYRNKKYHEPADTTDRLDFKRMAEVIAEVSVAVQDLANSK